ncbi:uncharacterized protein LOC126473470 [Schistocerca serialis cubense]|uniref:uncharacterized protein LOC126473470 n=1 Tax=Schistocerca serialis cubense TaxID=2023355 RepID=UPI00214ED1C0|nr:uncharacterized protein LOC126473470 [Schistocerca serialis cubense]
MPRPLLVLAGTCLLLLCAQRVAAQEGPDPPLPGEREYGWDDDLPGAAPGGGGGVYNATETSGPVNEDSAEGSTTDESNCTQTEEVSQKRAASHAGSRHSTLARTTAHGKTAKARTVSNASTAGKSRTAGRARTAGKKAGRAVANAARVHRK